MYETWWQRYITVEQTYNSRTSKLWVGFEPLHFKQRKTAILPKPTRWAANAMTLEHKDTNWFKFQWFTEATVYKLNYIGLDPESQATSVKKFNSSE